MYRELEPDTNMMPAQEYEENICPATGTECPLREGAELEFDPDMSRQRPGGRPGRPYYYHRPYPYYYHRPYPYYPYYPYPYYPYPYPYPYHTGYSED